MKNSFYVPLLLLAGQSLTAQERPNIVVFLVDDMGLMDTSLLEAEGALYPEDKDGNILRPRI